MYFLCAFSSESLELLCKTRAQKAEETEDPKRSEGDGGGAPRLLRVLVLANGVSAERRNAQRK